MSNLKEQPKQFQPYLFHGVQLQEDGSGDCPWCGREGKFGVSQETGQYNCFVCGESGNTITFLRNLWKESDKETLPHAYHQLQSNRGLLFPETLINWEACESSLTGEWLLPGYGINGKMNQLYRYCRIKGKHRLLATPEMNHGIFLPGSRVENPSTIYICEGPWDAMCLWELMSRGKETEKGIIETANPKRCLLSDAWVIAVPGCNVFLEPWIELFAGKKVVLLFDNDHPRVSIKDKKQIDGAGWAGVKRVGKLLSGAKKPPKEVLYLHWGDNGYNPDLPSGYDLRDKLTQGENGPLGTLGLRLTRLGEVLGKITPFPTELLGTKKNPVHKGGDLECLPCKNYRKLTQSWRKAMRWTDGLDHALATMLAVSASTKAIGDQLWAKVIGPAACGKSTLCEALSVAKKYVVAKSTIRGFHSGFREEGGTEAGEDNSLIAQLYDKTLITKDGDTLLQSPNLPQILSEARDLYDCTSRTHYRNKMSKDYEGVRMTWLLCGTSSLRSIDASELGERFLDCVIMESIDDDLEDEVLLRVVHKADRNMLLESNGDASSQYSAELREAMELTGGYLCYLRENANELLSAVQNNDSAKRLLTRLGKFTAFMRARPSLRQDETAEREFASRLVSQLTRLARCLAIVLNQKSVNRIVMERVRRVAMDTSRGQTLEIVQCLAKNPEGLDAHSLAVHSARPDEHIRKLIRFLQKIGCIESFTTEVKGVRTKQKFRLTTKMRHLFQEVMNEIED